MKELIDILGNPYEALEIFKEQYCEPLRVRLEEAQEILLDPNRRWEGKSKELAKKKYAIMDTQYINFNNLYASMKKVLDSLDTLYGEWYKNVSNEGKQPIEMMSLQAGALEDIFRRIKEMTCNK